MNKNENLYDAVSPVVGVMLMLVVTIIIAAIVSGFAGSMADSVSKTPQMTVKGTYSQSSGMTITHAGGDAVPLSELTFSTMPSELMGADYMSFLYDINHGILNFTDSDGESTAIMNNASGYYYKSALVPGDILTINREECNDYATDAELASHSSSNPWQGGSVNVNAQLWWGSASGDKGKYFRSYQFMNPENKGKYFYLIVRDSAETTIAKVKVDITA